MQESDRQVFRLFGYAGTGKTTLARHLAQDVKEVRFAAYTGKAAHVLQQKGCHGASTIHSLIYTPKGKSAERLRDLQRQRAGLDPTDPASRRLDALISDEETNLKRPSFVLNLDSPLRRTDLVIIDECSMVDDRVGEDLLHFGCKVLVLGDPAQLPPVRGGGYFTEHQPDILLTEIHRQARGNPIIDLATRVRQGERLSPGTYGDSAIVPHLTPEMALAADQIIVGRNRTRHSVNRRTRELKGFEGVLPNVGERLVCIRNNHDQGLLNGSIWIVEEIYDPNDPVGMRVRPEEESWTVDVFAHRCLFEGDEPDWVMRRDANEFEFGYALTCHKSQGSQWNSLVIVDESDAFRQHAKRWLYTAITRAAEKVIIKI
jgi:exodeoxyribonuclease-5